MSNVTTRAWVLSLILSTTVWGNEPGRPPHITDERTTLSLECAYGCSTAHVKSENHGAYLLYLVGRIRDFKNDKRSSWQGFVADAILETLEKNPDAYSTFDECHKICDVFLSLSENTIVPPREGL